MSRTGAVPKVASDDARGGVTRILSGHADLGHADLALHAAGVIDEIDAGLLGLGISGSATAGLSLEAFHVLKLALASSTARGSLMSPAKMSVAMSGRAYCVHHGARSSDLSASTSAVSPVVVRA